jgi:hypothetical protein
MARFKKWQQRGSADLVSVAVGIVILSIAATGTAASMIYGREVLGRQERYKVAAYMLRREMEKKIWELQSFQRAQAGEALQPSTLRTELVGSDERPGRNQPVNVEITMDRIVAVSDEQFDNVTAYWVITMHATWDEPDMVGGGSRDIQRRTISYRTAIDARS